MNSRLTEKRCCSVYTNLQAEGCESGYALTLLSQDCTVCIYIKTFGNTDLNETCTTHAASGHFQSCLTYDMLHIIYTLCNISIERSGRELLSFGLNLLKMLFLS